MLAAEAASALVMFHDNPAALVSACRRVLSRQLSCGPLWWVCANLLNTTDVRAESARLIQMLESDTTMASASLALDMEAAEVAAVEAKVFGGGAAIVDAAAWARIDGEAEQIWLVGGIGRHVNEALWASLITHWIDSPQSTNRFEVLLPIEDFTHVVGESGPVPIADLREPECPMAPELVRLAG